MDNKDSAPKIIWLQPICLGNARRTLAWCGELNDAQDFLEEALRAERNKG